MDTLGNLKPEMSVEDWRKIFAGETNMPLKQTVPQMLCSAADIYEQRNKIYGNNYFRFGTVAREILGNIELKSAEDFNRFGILVQILAKITRYGENFKRGGHDDSLDDLAVYAMMLKELDIAAREVDGNYPF